MGSGSVGSVLDRTRLSGVSGPAVAVPGGGARDAEEVPDLGPGVVLVAGVGDRVGESVLDFSLEAGEQVHGDSGVAVPVQIAQRAQCGEGFVEDGFAGVVVSGADVVVRSVAAAAIEEGADVLAVLGACPRLGTPRRV